MSGPPVPSSEGAPDGANAPTDEGAGREILATAARVLLFPIIVLAEVIRGPARYSVERYRGWMPTWQRAALDDPDHPLHELASSAPGRRGELLRSLPEPIRHSAIAAARASLQVDSETEAAHLDAARSRIAHDLELFDTTTSP